MSQIKNKFKKKWQNENEHEIKSKWSPAHACWDTEIKAAIFNIVHKTHDWKDSFVVA